MTAEPIARALTPAHTPSRSLGVRIRRTRDGLLLGLEGDALLLSDSAEFIYRQLDGRTSITDLARRLSTEYLIDEHEAAVDTIELLDQLGELGLVQW